MIKHYLKHKPIHSIESDVLEHRQEIYPLKDQRGFMFVRQLCHYTL